LKAEGLVTSPAFIVMKAADTFANPTTAINQLWQTDFQAGAGRREDTGGDDRSTPP
jgi:hypothetical protein